MRIWIRRVLCALLLGCPLGMLVVAFVYHVEPGFSSVSANEMRAAKSTISPMLMLDMLCWLYFGTWFVAGIAAPWLWARYFRIWFALIVGLPMVFAIAYGTGVSITGVTL